MKVHYWLYLHDQIFLEDVWGENIFVSVMAYDKVSCSF